MTTAAGYQGGYTKFPTYEETCTSLTGHTETVLVAYDPAVVSDEDVLRTFWENHDPTQGYRQGNDVGTQYRSAVYWTTPEQEEVVRRTHAVFQERLRERGFSDITTETCALPPTQGRSTTPRSTISSTCTRCRTGTARSTRRACACG